MTIIQKQPNPNGAYPAPQSWDGAQPPEGCAIIPNSLDMADFYAHNGFVTLEIEDSTVTDYTPNTEAWEAWKASLTEPPIDDITALQLAVAELAEAQAVDQTATELALVELAEIMAGG